jgi:hypothetical protein
LTWDKHLEHWIVLHRVGWLDWFFIDLSWLGQLGLVWIAIALVLAVVWRRPSLFLAVVVADVIADLRPSWERASSTVIDPSRPSWGRLRRPTRSRPGTRRPPSLAQPCSPRSHRAGACPSSPSRR